MSFNSFNKITFGEKKLEENIFQKINFCFSNGHNFDVLFYKRNMTTHLILERKYLDKIIKYSFANGGTYDQQTTQMFLPMISMMFLPLSGVFNLSELKFDEIYAGPMKTNLSNNLLSAFSGGMSGVNGINEIDENTNNEEDKSQSLIGNLFSGLKEVWRNDEEDEDERLDTFLVDENLKEDSENKETLPDSINDAATITEDEINITKDVILFDISLKIDKSTDFTARINKKDVNEMYETGRKKLLNDFKKYKMSGIKNIEFFGKNNENTRLTLSYEFDDVIFEYNSDDMLQIKEFLLKFCNFIKSKDTVLG
jgi:hypothetical protein